MKKRGFSRVAARVNQADADTTNHDKDNRRKMILFGDDELGSGTVTFEMPVRSAGGAV